jgi:Ca2+-binding RTX toxin-like protein
MRAPIVLPHDALPVVLAQAGRVVTIAKPVAGAQDVLRIGPGETLDLSRIGNEQIALVKLGNRLVVLFSDRSSVIVDGLYQANGGFAPNVRIGLDSATTVDTAQFAQQFSISADEQILTAAGINVAAGPRGSGGTDTVEAPAAGAANPESGLTPGVESANAAFGDAPQSRFADQATTTTTATTETPSSGTSAPAPTSTSSGSTAAAATAPAATPVATTPTFSLDLDTGAAGTGYAGVTEQEAARSRSLPGQPYAEGGAAVAQITELTKLDPAPNAIGIGLVDPADRITTISASVTTAATGETGVLRLSAGFATLPAPDSIVIDDAAHTIRISLAAGYSQADAIAALATLRFVSTDSTFNLDTSDRIVTVTITDQAGHSASAVASVPVRAEVSDGIGQAGINAFTGGAHADRIFGFDGSDVLNGGAGDDYIDGGEDDNTLDGGSGDNQLYAGSGDDTITAGDGNNYVSTGDGDNRVTLGNGNNQVRSGNGDDRITTGSGDDDIVAGDGTNIIQAGDGTNTVTGGANADEITTGSGNDTINAGDGQNVVSSGAGNDTITTGIGDDTIDAGAGDDRIAAGRGDDDIRTGTGADTIVFDSNLAQIGFDTLRDFQSGVDTLEFSLAVVGGAGSGLGLGGADTGTLDAARFTGGAFTTTDQRFRFDAGAKTLFYDADGGGAGSPEIALALVETGNLVAADIKIA